jgi:hypothetical protein
MRRVEIGAAKAALVGMFVLLAPAATAQSWDRGKNIEAAVDEAYTGYRRNSLAGVGDAAMKCYDRLKKRGLNRAGAAKEVEYCVSQDLVGDILLNVHGLGKNDKNAVLWEPLETRDGKTSPLSFRLVQLDIMSAVAKTDEEGGQLLQLWARTVRRLVDQRLATRNSGTLKAASSQSQTSQSDLAREGLTWAWGEVKARIRSCGDKLYVFADEGTLYQVLQPKLGLLKQKQMSDIDTLNGLQWDGEIVLLPRAARLGLFYQNAQTGAVRWKEWKEWEDIKYELKAGLRKKKGNWEIYSVTRSTHDALYVHSVLATRLNCDAIADPGT